MNSRFQSRDGPSRRAMPAACTGVGVNKVMTLSTPTLVQAAGMALRGGPTLDWKRKFILYQFVAGLVLFEGVFVGRGAS